MRGVGLMTNDSVGAVRKATFGWSPYLVATDALACLTSFAVIGRWDWTQVPMLLVTLGCLSLLGLYRSRLSLSLLDDVPFLVGSAPAGVTTWLAVHDILGVHDSVKDVVRLALISVMSLMLFRGLSYALVRWARRACLLYTSDAADDLLCV